MRKAVFQIVLFLAFHSLSFGQKYSFQLNEIYDVENKIFFEKMQLEFNIYSDPFKYTLVFFDEKFYINSPIEVKQEEFEIFLNKHGYSLKTFKKAE